jgi:uncharacterized membrane protein
MRGGLFLSMLTCSATAGELAVSHAMKCVGQINGLSPTEILRAVARACRLRWMLIGFALLVISLLTLLALLAWEEVSLVVPATAMSDVLGALGAKFLLGEALSARRWLGLSLVSIGVVLVWVGR